MARDGSPSERGSLGRLIDRLLGRDRADTSDSTALFTAHQPPPSGRPSAGTQEERAPDGSATGAATVPAPEVGPSEPDLFRERPGRQPRDAWEETPVVSEAPAPEAPAAPVEPEPPAEPTPAPTPEPEPAPESLQTSVHEDALQQVSPRARRAPGVQVHDDHLEQRSGPVQLTPSQAIELARGGRDTLRRRDRD